MVLLRPLTTDFSDSSFKFWSPFAKTIERKKKVEHGTPFGQTYGKNIFNLFEATRNATSISISTNVTSLGFSHTWMKFISEAGSNSPALKVDERTADLHYPVGPPYIATTRDMYNIVVRWAELVPKVYKAFPQLMSEMCMLARSE